MFIYYIFIYVYINIHGIYTHRFMFGEFYTENYRTIFFHTIKWKCKSLNYCLYEKKAGMYFFVKCSAVLKLL